MLNFPLAGALALALSLTPALTQPAASTPSDPDALPLSWPEADETLAAAWTRLADQARDQHRAEWTAKSITIGDKTMKFDYKVFGNPEPGRGRRLFISMHGGGSTPPEVNDQQWRNQIRLYTPEEGVYLAPRAPTDAWNMWHEAHIDAFFDRIIQDAALFENVDTNRVYLTGYSAGGDGVYQIGPRMADRWAAAAMMAGHPNDASPVNLRNVPFAIHVGELDAAFNRNKIGAEWGTKLDELHAADPDGYQHLTEIHKGRPHWMNREDASAIPWMAAFTRNPWPTRIVWRQDDVISPRLYWLRVDPKDAKPGDTITAAVSGSTITLALPASLPSVTLLLSDALVDLDRPVVVKVGERTAYEGVVPRTAGAIRAGLESRADPNAAPTAELTIRN